VTSSENNQSDEEKRKAREEDLRVSYRTHGFVHGIFLSVYVVLCFKGLASGIEGILEGFLPRFFAFGYGLAIVIGIGALIAHKGAHDKSWFDRFHYGWKGKFYGLVSLGIVVTFMILVPWIAVQIQDFSLWIVLPLSFIGVGVAIFFLIWALERFANWMGVNF